jgi:hypothetical protein
MSAPPLTATTWTWPADVVAFADRQQVRPYLDPLRQALDRVFPTAQSVTVYVDKDPEIRDDRHITFDVVVPQEDIPDYVAANRRWYDEFLRLCPTTFAAVFRVILIVASA